MNRTRPLALSVLVALSTGACSDIRDAAPTAAQAEPAVSSPAEAALGATLLQGLGDHDFPITSNDPEVLRWFNQGLMLTYGFNHDAAERAFLKATQLDPQCALCWWGAALVLGPHVNAAMDPTVND